MDTAKLERILKAKSSHDWVVKEVSDLKLLKVIKSCDSCATPLQEEREKEEEYFERLEKKENIEEKMATVKEIRVNVVQCKLVRYLNENKMTTLLSFLSLYYNSWTI